LQDWHAYELLPFLLLGVFGGLYGAVFTNLNVKWSKYVRQKTWMKTHPVWEVLLVRAQTEHRTHPPDSPPRSRSSRRSAAS
jgi:chloride channel 3/4/5